MSPKGPIFFPELGEDDSAFNSRETPILAILAIILVIAGLLPRFAQYLHYLALAPDEADVARHVLERSTSALVFEPLGNLIAPPPGFLVLTKASLAIGGANEYAVRFPAFLGGLLALCLFYAVARRFVSPLGAVIGLLFLASAKHLIVYGAFFRPYALDAGATVAILGCCALVLRKPDSIPWHIGAALICIASVWLSFPAALILGGAGLPLIINALIKGKSKRFFMLCGVFGASFASFLLMYYLSASKNLASPDQQSFTSSYWTQGGAMPFPPDSLADFKWFSYHFEKIFDDPCGFTLPAIAGFFALIGLLNLAARDMLRAAMLTLPIALALLASGLHLYPFWERTLLFLTPILFILVGEGIAALAKVDRQIARVAAVLALILIALVPAGRAARLIVQPSTHHELNVILDYAREHWQPGDVLYLATTPTQNAFLFMPRYAETFPGDAVVRAESYHGDPESNGLNQRLRAATRIWLPVTYDEYDTTVPKTLDALSPIATKQQEFSARGATMAQFSAPSS